MDKIHEYAPAATSCCIQLSSALNSAGLKVPQRSFWRENYYIENNGWALGSCDEVEYFLTRRFGATENIKEGGRGPAGDGGPYQGPERHPALPRPHARLAYRTLERLSHPPEGRRLWHERKLHLG